MSTDYNITKADGLCRACGKQLQVDEEFVATVREDGEDFRREDYCLACWEARGEQDGPDMLGLWRARVPKPAEKKKIFVDDEVLVNFFERLEGAEEPAKVGFRFVLTLVLMRKKLLVYDRSDRTGDGQDVWTLHFRGGQTHKVIDPHMDEDRIAEVSGQLGAILEGQL